MEWYNMGILRLAILALLLCSFVAPTGNYKDLVLNIDFRTFQGKKPTDLTGINYCNISGTGNNYDLDGYTFYSANSDVIDCGNNSNVNVTTKLSISMWILMRSTVTAVTKVTTATTGFSYTAVCNSDNKVYFQMSGNGTTVAYSQAQLAYPTGIWVHVMCVYDGDGAANSDRNKVYYNGRQIACNYAGTIPTSLYQTSTNLKINSVNNTTIGNGKYKMVKIWKRALTATEVMNEYRSTK